MPDSPPQITVDTSPQGAPRGMRRIGVAVVAGLCLLAASAFALRRMAGAFSYAAFLLSILGIAAALSFLVVWVWPARRRRRVGFRIAAVWLGIGIALAGWELAALLLPVGEPLDNPWYVFNAGGMRNSETLMVERPPHIRWSGWSRGDLSVLSGEPDQYARRITFETDFEGFRNSRDLSSADILFLGDSFTEAGNVPEAETFAARTADLLDRTGRNLGRATYCPSAELAVLLEFGLPCRPNLVVWQIAESNDLLEEVAYQEWSDLGRLSLPLRDRPDWISAWKRRSPTHQLYVRYAAPYTWPYGGIFDDSQGRPVRMLFLTSPTADQRPDGHAGWPLLAGALRAGAAELQEHGAQLIVLLIPMKIRVYGPHVVFDDSFAEARQGAWNIPETETLGFHLAALCAELDVPFINAAPILQAAAGRGELVYLPADTHLSSAGHRLVAEQIVTAVRDKSERNLNGTRSVGQRCQSARCRALTSKSQVFGVLR